MKDIGIYIHIPFCKQKCYYCDFLSFAKCENKVDEYIKSLINEIENNKIENEKKQNIQVSTVYIGGGTPSIIHEDYIEQIVQTIRKKFNVLKNAEVTIEINPGTVNEKKIQKYREVGINRLSIGLQSTNDKILNEIGRIHNFEQFKQTYITARENGFENINVDLMLALPNQTVQDLRESIENIIELNPEHISVYSLILEENTKLEQLVSKGELKLPDDDVEREMYWYVKNKLEEKGYKHYEISNFAKKGYESKHNLNCWNQMEYLGFGLGAHSYFEDKRYSNTNNLDEYIIGKNQIEIHEIQNLYDKQKEYMMLGLRKIDGVKISDFKNKFVQNPLYIFRNELEKLAEENLIIVNLDSIKLTNKGIDLANLVWEEFV